MLDRAEVFLMRKFDIFYRHIVLLIEPSAPAAGIHIPERFDVDGAIFGVRLWLGSGADTNIRQRCDRRLRAFRKRCSGAEITLCGACDQHALWQVLTRTERRQLRVPTRPTALVAGHVHVGIPTA